MPFTIYIFLLDPYLTEWIHTLCLTKGDEDTLTNGKWLSASHISAAQYMLKQRYPRQNGLLDTSYLRDRKTWLSVPDEFVQILCVNDCHWACVSNVFSEHGSVDLYDSLHTILTASGSIAQQVCTILKSQQHSVTINVVNVQKQIGCNDCGLYAIAMAADLCSRIDPFESSYDQSSMRIHLKECFESEPPTLTVFSTRRDSKEKRRLVHRKSVELFCLCRRPEVLPMASCDTCNMWYHEGCVPIPDDVLLDEDDSIPWICCQCKYTSLFSHIHN